MQIDLEQFRKPCSCGHVHEISVQGIWIEEGAVKRLYQMLTEEEELGEFIAPVIVWDDNTKEAAEEALEDPAVYGPYLHSHVFWTCSALPA